jgi:hypothetical protein
MPHGQNLGKQKSMRNPDMGKFVRHLSILNTTLVHRLRSQRPCKEMPVIPVNKMLEPRRRIIGKKWSDSPPPPPKKKTIGS